MRDEKYPEDLELICRFVPAELERAKENHDDTADEYALFKCSRIASGVIAYGKYVDRFGERWIPNPNARPIMKYLLDQLEMFGWKGATEIK